VGEAVAKASPTPVVLWFLSPMSGVMPSTKISIQHVKRPTCVDWRMLYLPLRFHKSVESWSISSGSDCFPFSPSLR
jgi:hypothetical protein